MSKNVINIGLAPGGQGDGDTLRDAFSKTNKNFDELYRHFPVTDVTLIHDDVNVEGGIAKALLDAGLSGGGTVLLGPGIFKCQNKTLIVPENVILKGSGKGSTIIKLSGYEDGITLSGKFSGLESIQVSMSKNTSANGINLRANYVHVRDVFIVGGNYASWGINADRVNACKIDNVTMGTIGPYNFTGNGILFQNTDPVNSPWNFGDSMIVKVDINLSRGNTTGIKFHGPEDTNNVINNILLSQVDILVENSVAGCKGIHLVNATRITCNHVDIENHYIAILEESIGTGNNVSTCNSYISTFVFNSIIGYKSTGNVHRRLFFGCDNLMAEGLNDNDVSLPRALWLNDNNCKIEGSVNGELSIDDGDSQNGLRLVVDSENPVIKSNNKSTMASITLGSHGSRGVICLPGIVLPAYNVPPVNASDGTIVQFAAGVVGDNRGLYQIRNETWHFIA